MKLSEYLKQHNKTNLNSKEILAFGIEDISKGWKERYKDKEITETMIKASRSKKRIKKIGISLKIASGYKPNNNKLLYLMENSLGNLKIGITSNLKRRIKELSNASGIKVCCLAAWELEGDSRAVETYLHTKYQNYRLMGEWFKSGLITAEHIELNLMCKYERVSFI